MSRKPDPLWRERALAGIDPLSPEAFAIRRAPLQRGERRLIKVRFAMLELLMLFDELAAAAGAAEADEAGDRART